MRCLLCLAGVVALLVLGALALAWALDQSAAARSWIKLARAEQWLEWLPLPALAFIAAVVVGLFFSPDLMIDPDLRATLPEPDRAKADHDARTLLVQVVGGLLLLATGYFTWQEIQANQEQLRIARQGQLTERLTQAVEQLGSDRCEIRTGGIYALGLVADISSQDRGSITEILTAYIRRNASWPSQQGQACAAAAATQLSRPAVREGRGAGRG